MIQLNNIPADEKQKAEDLFHREGERESARARSVEMAGVYCCIRAPHLMVHPKVTLSSAFGSSLPWFKWLSISLTHSSPLILQRLHGLRCSSSTPDNNFNKNMNKRETQTPQILKLAVSGVTELLRLFSSSRYFPFVSWENVVQLFEIH